LKEDEGQIFSPEQTESFQYVLDIVLRNGANVRDSLQDVVEFLNSANQRQIVASETNDYFDCFLSYGRKHSLGFTRLLYHYLTSAGYKIWFDMNDIPLAVDFQNQIDEGIVKSHNFIFIISPHSVKSEYCLKEILLAEKLGKRIIPICHVFPIEPEVQKMINPTIARINWVPINQDEDTALNISQKALNLRDAVVDIPMDQWNIKDNFESAVNNIKSIFASNLKYVQQHTFILHNANQWDASHRNTEYLLVDNDRIEGENWLLKQEFRDERTGRSSFPPCKVTKIQAEYIVESKKNTLNMMTDVFICSDKEDKLIEQKITNSLLYKCISTWTHQTDVVDTINYETEVHHGLEGADIVIFIMSRNSVISDSCIRELEMAMDLQKRIIPIKIENFEHTDNLNHIQKLPYIDVSDCVVGKNEKISKSKKNEIGYKKDRKDFDRKMDELIKLIRTDQSYYNLHKIYLVQALKWQRQKNNHCILLRGHSLDNANTWVRISENKITKPLPIHKEYIFESEKHSANMNSDVFISYSRKDGDFARKLNFQLQLVGKQTWFDQENISSGTNFQEEIFRGIEYSHIFLFIISPDSVASPYCDEEVAFATKLNKKFITVLCRPVDIKELPPQLSAIQWISFFKTDFNHPFSELLRTLDTDREHIQKHTLLLQRAMEWEQKRKPAHLLLGGNDITEANIWLIESYEKSPSPLPLHIEYIEQSKLHQAEKEQKAKRYIRNIRASLFAAVSMLIVAICFVIYALISRNKAEVERSRANTLFLATKAMEFYNIDPTKAMKTAQLAYNLDNTNNSGIAAITQIYYNAIYRDNFLFYNNYCVEDTAISFMTVSTDPKSNLIITLLQGGKNAHLYSSKNSFTSLTHDDVIKYAVFSNNGEYIATMSKDNTAKIWDKFGKNIATLAHNTDVIGGVFSKDNKTLVTYSQTEVKIWKTNGELVRNIDVPSKESVTFCDISSDAKEVLLSCIDYKIRKVLIYDPNSPIEILGKSDAQQWHTRKVVQAKYLPDNQHVISISSDSSARIWNQNNELETVPLKLKRELTFVDFSKNGKLILLGTNDSIAYVWDWKEGTNIALNGHSSRIRSGSFKKDHTNLIVTAGTDHKAIIWSDNGKIMHRMTGHSADIVSSDFTPDGTSVLTASTDRYLRKWKIYNRHEMKLQKHQAPIMDLAFTKNSERLISTSKDGLVIAWDLDSAHTHKIAENIYAPCVDISPDNELIGIGDANGNVLLYDSKTLKLVTKSKLHNDTIFSLQFGTDRNILTNSKSQVLVSDFKLQNIKNFPSNNGVKKALFSHNGENVIVFSHILQVYKNDATHLYQYNYEDDKLNFISVQASPIDDDLFCYNSNRVFQLSGNGKILHPIKLNKSRDTLLLGCEVTFNKKYLFSMIEDYVVKNYVLQLHDIKSGDMILRISIPVRPIAYSLSSDYSRIVLAFADNVMYVMPLAKEIDKWLKSDNSSVNKLLEDDIRQMDIPLKMDEIEDVGFILEK